jgi:hypothetical protein
MLKRTVQTILSFEKVGDFILPISNYKAEVRKNPTNKHYDIVFAIDLELREKWEDIAVITEYDGGCNRFNARPSDQIWWLSGDMNDYIMNKVLEVIND